MRTALFVTLLIATVVAVAVFGCGAVGVYRAVAAGRPAPGRTDRPGRRLWLVAREVLGHTRFAHRPAIRAAHWCVMVSFPVLILTLVAGYGQLLDPGYSLPLLGHLAPIEWVTEFLAWAALLGISGLIVYRLAHRPGRTAALTSADSPASPASPVSPASPASTESSVSPASPASTESSVSAGSSQSTGSPESPASPASRESAAPPEPDTAWGAQAGGPQRRASRGRWSRFVFSRMGQAYFVEATVWLVVAAVLVLRGLEYAAAAQDPASASLASPLHFPLTGWYGSWLTELAPDTIAAAVTWVAAAKIAVSLSWFVVVGLTPAMGVAWHRFLALITVYSRRELDGRPALGALAPLRVDGEPLDVRNLDDLPDDVVLGAGTIDQLSWKNLLDTATCTECGRCQEVCPAWTTGKVLSPKRVVLQLRDEAFAVAAGATPRPLVGAVAGWGEGEAVVEAEALWDCTMCGACVDACPVDIEHVDIIAELRRHQTLMEGAAPRQLGQALRKVETRANPWGLPARQRLDWAQGLQVPVPVLGVDIESAAGLDYLFWVGCAGAFDERGKRTTRAVAELLQLAGVSFAVLGTAESCTGDSARRAGNEVLFQQMALGNIEQFAIFGVTRIIATCPHCFNTLAREYPELGGHYVVEHHTQVLNRLVREGRLTPSAPPEAERTLVTLHDPCYLGRHNGSYDDAREVAAASGARLVEMEANKADALCCGAGGGRVWQEEHRGVRIAEVRGVQAAATGASELATACPFCSIMLTPGVPTLEVKDVAVRLLEACQRTA